MALGRLLVPSNIILLKLQLLLKSSKILKLNYNYKVYKKAQLSLTNPRDAKACQKLFKFDVLTTLSLTILVYIHTFSSCCV